ncbi:hypothetical protein RvY_04506 [Ramazzottius varieornatus]|uniref:Uncharacterized protein n=1 Tax=Ramazzottius varieornatus TaxID=947166 RepID=A0A1D1URW8_RAMVA|nr:hypothetical protein RvY_04506 [Ramazzottius varieornatus]
MVVGNPEPSTNAKGGFTLRQTVRQYSEHDWIRKMLGKRKINGRNKKQSRQLRWLRNYERNHLNWRDCFFLMLPTAGQGYLEPDFRLTFWATVNAGSTHLLTQKAFSKAGT